MKVKTKARKTLKSRLEEDAGKILSLALESVEEEAIKKFICLARLFMENQKKTATLTFA
jgi:hypothetical protein